MESSVTQCRHLLALATPVLAGLGDEHLGLEPRPGTKTAGWLIGHLTVTGDFGRRLCGRPPMCPKEWRALFNPGSRPSLQRADYPSMDELRDAFHRVYTDLCEVAATADPQALAAENPYEPTRSSFPTAGSFVAYLLSGHFAYHFGQLFAWRAAAGLGGPDRSDTMAA
jgi:hypothetical protein